MNEIPISPIKANEQTNNLLKNCPFCRGKDLAIYGNVINDKSITFYKIVHYASSECSVSMVGTDKEKLIDRWNKRKNILK